MSELVTLQLDPIFHNLRQRVEGLRDGIVKESATIMRREWATRVRQRFFRTGATLASAAEKVESHGHDRLYTLTPTATNKGAPYPLFGEYGTGRRGALSGGPAPAGYTYGDRQGMRARRFSRIAVGVAKPQIDAMAREQARRFAANATI